MLVLLIPGPRLTDYIYPLTIVYDNDHTPTQPLSVVIPRTWIIQNIHVTNQQNQRIIIFYKTSELHVVEHAS